MNLNYNGNTIRIDDETFDLNGESTLLSLRNGGGKTVLVQMVTSLFVHKTYRDFGDRSFQNYFTTNQPTFIMTEWKLDEGQGYFLVGMMVRKCQNLEENNQEPLEMINFTGFYKVACEYDLDNLPVIDELNGNKILKGFGACKREMEQLKKNKENDFDYYDMCQPYQRTQYFNKLKEYQINYKEWETIIKKVNLKESGLSELFANAKDEKGLVEKWFLDAIENKLNQESNRIKSFQKLAYKFICQYRENQSKIKRKEIIEQYFIDAAELEEQIELYCEAEQELAQHKGAIAAFIHSVNEMVEGLRQSLEEKNQEKEQLEEESKQIEHEKISYDIYQLEDEKADYVENRVASEMRINSAAYAKEQADCELCKYQCARLYEEATDFKEQITQWREQIRILTEEQKDRSEEREQLGSILYQYYKNAEEDCKKQLQKKQNQIQECETEKQNTVQKKEEETEVVKEISVEIGALQQALKDYGIVEGRFNTKYKENFARNILGEYETAMLELAKKKFQDETLETSNAFSRCAEKQITLKKEAERLNQQREEIQVSYVRCEHEMKTLDVLLDQMQEEKIRRQTMMKYVEAPDSELDEKILLAERFERKISELVQTQDEWKQKKSEFAKEYENLKQGKVVELSEAVIAFFEEQNISFLYGMEWLKKNGRSVKENQQLTEQNPFLPYSIILSQKDIEKLQQVGNEIYTNFPIPIVAREDLETALPEQENCLISFGKIHFFVMFNTLFLNPDELERMLQEKLAKIEEIKDKIAIKSNELKEYREYLGEINRQTFTLEKIEKTKKQIAKKQEEQKQLQEEEADCRQKKKQNQEAEKENEKQMRFFDEKKKYCANREEAFIELVASYECYMEKRQALELQNRKKKEAEEQITLCEKTITEVEDRLIQLREEKQVLNSQQVEIQEQKSVYINYENVNVEWDKEQFELAKAKAHYEAITSGILASLKDLQENVKKEEERFQRKSKELEKRNRYGFKDEELVQLVVSEEQIEHLEQNKRLADKEVNAANEENNKLEKKISDLSARMEERQRNLLEKRGSEVLVEREKIVHLDFEARLKLVNYDKVKKEKEIEETKERLDAFCSTQDAMADCVDFERTGKEEVPDLSGYTREELRDCQGTLRNEWKAKKNQVEKQKRETEKKVWNIKEKVFYQEDFFKKGLEHFLALIDQAEDMKIQLQTLLASYKSILEKLQVDLENVDRERKNVEENFFEYIKDMNEHMQKIDKNSTISVRGRSIKMLKIQVPSWDDNKELYRRKLSDYVEYFIQSGLKTIEEDGNVEELLGKLLTSKNLYDEVVGIGNIGIRLYKIEAEREVLISWKEVSENSGGEGFLSAFVILTCLLSYMRRDENDLFATGEEGKVLIMDNPFAQTNAEHLLKPLMDMAKKTNTQLICLSGLGGDSIYNRFDNIYVLNLEKSNIRQGMQYMRSNHIKGEEIKKMVLSQFKVEQPDLLDWEEV